MRRKLVIAGIIFGLAILSGLGIMLFQHNKLDSAPVYTGPVESLRVGIVKEYATLVLVAQNQGMFRDNGLDVMTTEYTSGAPSLQALLDGQVDVAIGSDFSGVSTSFKSQDFQALSAIFDSPDVFQLIARKDHGIAKPEDLKGKKIGLTKKTMGEFFLGTFLTFHNLSLPEVTLINDEPAALAAAIDKGTVDAVIDFQPYGYEIKKNLADNAIVFSAQGNQLLYSLLYTSRAVIAEHPNALQRFVQALARAAQYIEDHPTYVRSFFADQFHYPDDYIATVISHFNFRLSLSQSMLLAMEDEARWAIENKLTAVSKIPNYLDFIYFGPLEAVQPERITIIR